MIPKETNFLEKAIGRLLWWGTWLAVGVITLGLILDLTNQRSPTGRPLNSFGTDIVKSGIALFILLPIARVGLMFGVFLRQRDYTYAALSALVLAIIAIGVVMEM